MQIMDDDFRQVFESNVCFARYSPHVGIHAKNEEVASLIAAHSQLKKYTADAKVNSSRWRKYTNIIQGEKVLIKRQTGRNKYSSMFERIPYTVTDIRGSRYELVKDTDYDNSQPIYRHLNDIKKYRSCPTPKIHPTN